MNILTSASPSLCFYSYTPSFSFFHYLTISLYIIICIPGIPVWQGIKRRSSLCREQQQVRVLLLLTRTMMRVARVTKSAPSHHPSYPLPWDIHGREAQVSTAPSRASHRKQVHGCQPNHHLSASCSFYSYTPHFPSPFSFLPYLTIHPPPTFSFA